MSAVAVFQMFCCNRLFAWGRYEGNSDSSSGFYPQAWCWKCDPSKEKQPRINQKTSTCTFVGYTFDDRLDYPLQRPDFFVGWRIRFLTFSEIERFTKNDIQARERLQKYPLPRDQAVNQKTEP